ncbi:MAG: hypothetical protein AAFP76_06005 [Bacteroidota bacterium]
MKKFMLLLLGVFLCISCGSKEDQALIGTWKLTEQLIDIGDGKGTFRKIPSEKTIQFFSDGTFASNGYMCQMFNTTGPEGLGTYSAEYKTLSPSNCKEEIMPIHYEVKNGSLILSYPCIEPCQQKFVKI